MKTKYVLAFFALCVAPLLSAKTMVIGYSPFWSEASHMKYTLDLLKYAASLEAGDEVIFIDAFNLEPIGDRFIVPAGKKYEHPRARLAKNGAVVSALKSLPVKTSQKFRSGAKPSVEGAVLLPQFMRYVADNYRHLEARDVVVIGSPLYDNPLDSGFSMAHGLFPSDGHLSASRELTVFGAKETPNILDGWRIHMAYGDNAAVMRNDRHSYYIKRWRTLWAEALGGSLVSFVADPATSLQRATRSEKAIRHSYQIEMTDSVEMIRLRLNDKRVPIYDRTLSVRPLTQAQINQATQVQVGITWSCPDGHCDLDLYARPDQEANILYFGNTRSKEGVYYKDVRKPPSHIKASSINGFETIEFNVPVDLNKLKIAVALFSGFSHAGIEGEVRLMVDGETYGRSFEISASSGGKTSGIEDSFREGSATEPHIVMIDPLDIVSQSRKIAQAQ